MRLYSESEGISRKFGLSDADGARPAEGLLGIGEAGGADHVLVLLWPRSTLYEYPLSEVDEFRRTSEIRVLGAMCEELRAPRGSGNRRWVNCQDGQSNFNANVFLETASRAVTPEETFALQEKISVAIARTLERTDETHPAEKGVGVHFPFHYVLGGGKVAGHLLQSRAKHGSTALRIGIGINSGFAPELPKNDELSGRLYRPPEAFRIGMADWIGLYRKLVENLLSHMERTSCHEEYLALLTTPPGSEVRVRRDDGTIRLGEKIAEGTVAEISPQGRIVLENGKSYGTDCHFERIG